MQSTKYHILPPDDGNHQNPPVVDQNFFCSLMKVFFFCAIFFVTLYSYLALRTDFISFKNEVAVEEKFIHLKNIHDDDQKLKASANNQIYFVESHLEGERSFEKVRQACSLEAAARINPSSNVFLLMATTSNGIKLTRSKWFDVLQTYQNIHFRYFNIYEFTKGTILEEFIKKGAWKTSQYQLEHMSDFMRLVTVYKYGGLYLDLDIIMTEPLKYLEPNFVCQETPNALANSIFYMDTKDGRKYTAKCLKELSQTYDPNQWSLSGPILLSRIAHGMCPNTTFNETNKTQCDLLTIFPVKLCFPIGYSEYAKFYKADHEDKVMGEIQKSYFVHIWNKMQDFKERFDRIELNSTAPYLQLARTHCPRIYDNLEEFF